MTELVLYPHIAWKIKTVSGFCKKKSPKFTICGQKWKLKFIYRESTAGNVCHIILKRYENVPDGVGFAVSSFFTLSGTRYAEQSLVLSSSSLNEWLIWEAKENYLTHNYGKIDYIWSNCIFFCSVTPTSSSWTYFCSQNADNAETETGSSYSPCVTSLCHDFAKLFNNHLMSNVILASGDRKIYAHKAILASRSEVFAAMFRTDMRESREETVEILDMEPPILEQLVRYIYSGEVPGLSSDNVHQLYMAADKYRVEALKMKCGVFIIENPAPESVTQPTAAEVSNVGSLKEAVVAHFGDIKAIICSKEWQKLAENEPKFAHEAFLFFVSKSPS